jgi:hypothetical protein
VNVLEEILPLATLAASSSRSSLRRPVNTHCPMTLSSIGGHHPSRTVLSSCPMRALKAQVRNGRLVLDEPTNLPE